MGRNRVGRHAHHLRDSATGRQLPQPIEGCRRPNRRVLRPTRHQTRSHRPRRHLAQPVLAPASPVPADCRLAYQLGRQAYLTEIKSRVATVTPYLDKHWPTGGTTMVSGDPVWLKTFYGPRSATASKLCPAGKTPASAEPWATSGASSGTTPETVQPQPNPSAMDDPTSPAPRATPHRPGRHRDYRCRRPRRNHAGRAHGTVCPPITPTPTPSALSARGPVIPASPKRLRRGNAGPTHKSSPCAMSAQHCPLHLGVDSRTTSPTRSGDPRPRRMASGQVGPRQSGHELVPQRDSQDMRGEFDKPTHPLPFPSYRPLRSRRSRRATPTANCWNTLPLNWSVGAAREERKGENLTWSTPWRSC